MYLYKIRTILYHRVRMDRIYFYYYSFQAYGSVPGDLATMEAGLHKNSGQCHPYALGFLSGDIQKYSYGLRLFALAVSAMLYMMALDFAPVMVSIITQFFFPIQKPRTDCSAALLSIGTSPSSRNTFRYFSWLRQYMNPSWVLPF